MLELEAHRFQGRAPEFVLIVAGIHTSEQAGIEIARWISVKLGARETPTRLGAVVIPEIFPDRALAARTAEFPKNNIGDWREDVPETRALYKSRSRTTTKHQIIKTARQFPPPGRPLSFLSKGVLRDDAGADLVVDGVKVPLQPEIDYLLRVIEALKPIRIVSIHGQTARTDRHLKNAIRNKMIEMTDDEIRNWHGEPIHGVNFPGVFVDPRYTPSDTRTVRGSLEACKFNPHLDPAFPLRGGRNKKRFDSARTQNGRSDDALCLAVARAVGDKTLVAGNHVDDPKPVVHYAREEESEENPGYSLGDWGPVDVAPGKNTPGSRRGAPVFTVEVKENHESWAFFDRQQMVTEDGKPLAPSPTPAERANKKTPKAVANPSFDFSRSRALQAYADAIIATILEL